MGKRKIEQVTEDSITPASSEAFSSLVSKYSFSASVVDEQETKPSPLATPPESPPKQRTAKKTPRASPSKSKNLGYAPPSAYSHIPTPDLDSLAHNLILLFIGLNPGILRSDATLTTRNCDGARESWLCRSVKQVLASLVLFWNNYSETYLSCR